MTLFQNTYSTLSTTLTERGFETPTPVQEAVIKQNDPQRDLLVSAQTGSGKTVAFGLALAPLLLNEEGIINLPKGAPSALIIAPTRELALQVCEELRWLYKKTRAKIISCVGGMDARREARALKDGCHIVVGTPGRLCDHLNRKTLLLSKLKAVVLDEADEMLKLGFREDLETLLNASPDTRRTLLFSATISKDIAQLAKKYQKDAIRIDTIGKQQQHTDITYVAMLTPPRREGAAIINILRYFDAQCCIVFCHTREAVRTLQSTLVGHGFNSVAISGELGQNERSRALSSLKSGQTRVCVATDVAARGIDVPHIDLVIHASLPSTPATLLHRSGRTGRAGRKGTCLILTPPSRKRQAERLIRSAKVSAQWRSIPSPAEIHQSDGEKLLKSPQLNEPLLKSEQKPLATQLVQTYDAQQLAAAVVNLWEEALPKVVELPPITAKDNSAQRRGGKEKNKFTSKGDWFKISKGRNQNMEPGTLIAILCKSADMHKSDIGAIRIEKDRTNVEITPSKAQKILSLNGHKKFSDWDIAPTTPPKKNFRGGARKNGGPRRRRS